MYTKVYNHKICQLQFKVKWELPSFLTTSFLAKCLIPGYIIGKVNTHPSFWIHDRCTTIHLPEENNEACLYSLVFFHFIFSFVEVWHCFCLFGIKRIFKLIAGNNRNCKCMNHYPNTSKFVVYNDQSLCGLQGLTT